MPRLAEREVPPSLLNERLGALRRRMWFVTSFRGTALLVSVAILIAVAGGCADWRWQLPGLARALILVGGLSAAGYLAIGHLLRPLAVKTDNLSLALRIEERYGGLNDALASAVQFLEDEDNEELGSPALRRVAVQKALKQAQRLNFHGIVDDAGLRLAGIALVLTVGIATALLVSYPAPSRTALLRLATPFGTTEWPRQTQIALAAFRERVGRNEPFEMHGVVRGVIPEQATVTFRFEDGSHLEQACPLAQKPDAPAEFNARLDPGRVQRTFQFQIRANDASTEWLAVEVLPPPTLVPLDGRPTPHVGLQFPAYTDLPPQLLADGDGNVEAVAGTVVTFRALADRPLAKAWIEYEIDPKFAEVAGFLAPLGGAHLVGVLTATMGGAETWALLPARLDVERRRLEFQFLPRVSGLYVLHLEDEAGLRSTRLFELHVRPDRAPGVQLDRPSPKSDILDMLPTADFPLHVTAEDVQYAVRSVYLEYRIRCAAANPAATSAVQRLPLYDFHALQQALAVASVVGPFPLPRSLQTKAPLVHLERRLSLNRFRSPAAKAPELKEGDVVVLQACAEDFDDFSLNKQPGRSHEVEIHIISRNALDLLLNQEQAKLQQELVKAREQQREASKKVADAAAKQKRTGQLTPEDLNDLLQAEQTQQQLRDRIGPKKDEGLRGDAKRILETLKNNHLPRSASQDRVEAVQAELDRLAREELEQIESRLTAARKLNEKTDAEKRQHEAETKERLASEDDRQANEAEQQAKEGSDTEKEKAKEAAERLREQAKELCKEAEALKKDSAAQQKNESGATPKSDKATADMLQQARQHQDEVEKTLDDLLSRLEPWSSTREIKGEAKALLQEQRKLNEEVAGLQKNLGTNREQLTPAQQAELDKAAAEQQKLQERTAQLLDKMDRVAQEREQKDPETAKELKKAHDKGQQSNVTGNMQSAQKEIEQNELGKASQSQRQAAEKLNDLVKELEDRREAELDRLAKKLKEAEQKLDDLFINQEDLQKKVQAASQIEDPKKREEELKRLAREQRQLQEEAQEMAKQLSRLRAERASQSLSQAGAQMEQAARQLEQGQKPDEAQEEALDRLDEAAREVEQSRKRAEEELQREQLARIADAVKQLRERETALIAEAERIEKQVLQNNGWPRGLLASLGDLARNQKGLASETRQVADDKLSAATVAARILNKSAEAMDRAGQLLEERRQPENRSQNADGDAEIGRAQREALRRIDQLLEAIKPENAGRGPGGGSGGTQPGGGEGEGGGGGGGAGDGIPFTAQLKLLRSLQGDVNQRTEEFHKAHPDPTKYTDPEKASLQSLRKEQQEIGEMFDELTQPALPQSRAPQESHNGHAFGSYIGIGAAVFRADEPDKPEPPVRLQKKKKSPTDEPPKPAAAEEKKDDAPKAADAPRTPATPPKEGDVKEPPEPDEPPMDEKEILERLNRNLRNAEDRLANQDPGDGTQQVQRDILKDIDALLEAQNNQQQQQSNQDQQNDPSANPSSSQNQQQKQQQSRQSSQQSGQPQQQMGRPPGQQMTGRERRELRRQMARAQGRNPGRRQPQPSPQDRMTEKEAGDQPGAGDNKKKEEGNRIADVYKDVWGHLPEALRGEMNAYSREQFMAKYGDLIRQYYATLSEKGRKKSD